MKSLNSPDDNKREQIIKIKENFFKKKIKNKPKYNTMNNSIYNNTISTNKKFFSLRKKLIKYQPLDNSNNLLETENSLVNKFNFNRYNSLKKQRKKYIRIKNNVNSYSQLSSFYLNKDDFFYT